jgi:hypothetical protein
VWRIHRRIGMSGGLLINVLLRETGHRVTAEEAAHLQEIHAEAYARQVAQVRPLPGARELLIYLQGVPWAIATSGRLESARSTSARRLDNGAAQSGKGQTKTDSCTGRDRQRGLIARSLAARA